METVRKPSHGCTLLQRKRIQKYITEASMAMSSTSQAKHFRVIRNVKFNMCVQVTNHRPCQAKPMADMNVSDPDRLESWALQDCYHQQNLRQSVTWAYSQHAAQLDVAISVSVTAVNVENTRPCGSRYFSKRKDRP